MTKKEKGKRMKNAEGETELPEEVIQHIQSLMTGKEAAQTTILSKSWYKAWLTRPAIDFYVEDFHLRRRYDFEEFAKKTMQRYQYSNLKIESFSIHMNHDYKWAHYLIVNAINMGATQIKLKLPNSSFILPQEVLGSKTLVKLFLHDFKFEGSYVINCSMLKSLTLGNVNITSADDLFKNLTSRCTCMEELSLSSCSGLELRGANMYELHKLKRLFLKFVSVDDMFFTDFTSRFPCLKDLTIHNCKGCTRIHITSTSLQTISFEPSIQLNTVKFDVPNIRKFTCSGVPSYHLPSYLSINGASRWEWELDMSVYCYSLPKASWLMNLKKVLNKFKRSRISLSMGVDDLRPWITATELEVDVEVVRNPLVLENLIIHAPPTLCCALLVRSFSVFHPNYITHRYWIKYLWGKVVAKSVRERLIQALFVSNCQDKFGQFGLKKVNMEICEEFDTEWRPLQLQKALTAEADVRFQLIWED